MRFVGVVLAQARSRIKLNWEVLDLLKIAGSQVQINAEDVDFSNEATELLPCNYDGVDLEIAFNSRFLIEMLSNLQTEEIQMNMSLPNRAGLITPVSDAKDSHEDILMLVMPVMIG